VSARAQDAAEPAASPIRVSFAGEITGTFAPEDDGYFNYTDYSNSVVRLFTASVDGALHVGDRVELLGEVRLQNTDATASGLYVRVRPWRDGPLALQAGRIPPVFGRFARRGYGRSNPLIGVPLAYQYLTTLRASEVPWGSDALLAVRGRGWLVTYPRYASADPQGGYGPGLPLVSSMRWDTGVQAHVAATRYAASVALTNGSLSNPRVGDDNGGKQVAARASWQPAPAIDLGVSFSRGAFLARNATNALPVTTPRNRYVQTAVGVDAEGSAGYWVIRGEAIVSRWTLPEVGMPAIEDPLRAVALTLEGRYRWTPRLHVAARGERLTFSDLRGATQYGTLPWDAPVSRIEVGAGYALTRHVSAKAAWQYNWRQGVDWPQPREGLLAVQVAAWF
jgi:hypothetical protein